MSAIEKLDERLSAVETALAQMKEQLQKPSEPWWKDWMGAFQDDPYFEEAMRFGQEWRRGKKTTPKKKRNLKS